MTCQLTDRWARLAACWPCAGCGFVAGALFIAVLWVAS